MKPRGWLTTGVALLSLVALLAAPLRLSADALSELPAAWQETLRPIAESDISGAEPLVQQAIREARADVASLLAESEADRAVLADAYGRLGAIYQLHDVYAGAEPCFHNARKLEPEIFRWAYYAGYLALRSGRTDEALRAFEVAGELDPDYPPLALRLGEVWFEKSELDQARAAFERAAAQPGLRAAAHYYLGQIARLERDFEAAVEHLQAALALDPQATEVHYPLALAYRGLGQDDLARQHLSEFKQRLPAAEDPLVHQLEAVVERSIPLFRRGMQAIRQRDYPVAAEHFRAGLEIDPDNRAARISYARALYLSGRPILAREALGQVLAQNPEEPLANFLLGVLLEKDGEVGEAAAGYQRVLEIDHRHPGAHFYLANLAMRQGEYPRAAHHYGRALEENPDVEPARLQQLLALQRAGEPASRLLQRLETALAAYPNDDWLCYAGARLFAVSADAALRDGERALELVTGLVTKRPIPPFLETWALANAAVGRFDRAGEIQRQLVASLSWLASEEQLEQMKSILADYEKGRMPQVPAWAQDDPLLAPPPLDPDGPFRDYPAALPY